MAHLLAPTPKTRQGDGPPLQPHFFHSSLFVDPLREDITALLKAYIDRCKVALATNEDVKPFEWFKVIWRSQGWHLFHLRCTQARPRKAFLETTFRLFCERLVASEPVLHRLTALFAVYTCFGTQPQGDGIDLYRLPYILVPIDLYEEIIRLPSLLPPTFDHYATHIILSLLSFPSGPAFALLPPSSTLSQNPSVLPNSTVSIVPSSSTEASGSATKGKGGRPSALELQRRSMCAVSALDEWAATTPSLLTPSSLAPTSNTDAAYAQSKTTVTASVPHEEILAAEESVVAKMKQLEEIRRKEGWIGSASGSSEGIVRLEEAMNGLDRLLGLSKAVREAQQSASTSS